MPAVVAAACAAFAPLLSVTPAAASAVHAFSQSFGSEGSAAGQVSSPPQVAVNTATHDVYVADAANHRVDQFEADGTFVRAWGWGVADGVSEELQTCTLVCFAGLPGSGAGQLTTPTFIAVDNSGGPSEGDVYVGDTASNSVLKFSGSGAFISSNDGSSATSPFTGPFGPLAGIAVDSAGNLWVVENSRDIAFEFDQSGAFVKDRELTRTPQTVGIALDSADDLFVINPFGQVIEFSTSGSEPQLTELGVVFTLAGSAGGIAIDPATNDLYLDEGSQIQRISSACASECAAVETFGSPQLTGAEGLAVDPSQGATIYAADTATNQIDSFTLAIEAVTGPASAVTATTATLSGSVNPEGSPVSDCHFEYIAEGGAPQIAECQETVGSGTSSVAVHAEVSELQVATNYRYRLLATNARATVEGEYEAFSTSAIPVIDAAAATNLARTTATLTAQVNPKGLPLTACRFDYGLSASYEHSAPCVPGFAEVPADSSDHLVSASISGLQENRTWHWRIVAEDADGAARGSAVDHTFVYRTTGVSLPDGRAYEMVSPPHKNGALLGDVSVAGGVPVVSADGSRVLTPVIQCFSEAQSCQSNRFVAGSPYEFSRSGAGWQASALAPPASELEFNTSVSYDADTGAALFSAPTPPQLEDDWWLRRPDGSFVDVGPATPPSEGSGKGNPATLHAAATGDFSHFVAEAPAPLWPFDPSERYTAYEWAGAGNPQPLLVAVSGGAGSQQLIGRCARNRVFGEGPGLMSADGRIVYFYAEGCGAGSEPPVNELFARIDNTEADAHTAAVSEPNAPQTPSEPDEACTQAGCLQDIEGGPVGEANWRDARFYGASEDGRQVFFASTQRLTDAASQDPSTNDSAVEGCSRTAAAASGCNLYEYDFSAARGHRLTDLSAGDSGGPGPRVQGAMAISADGSHVYFVARGALTAAANERGQTAAEGAENLYVFERDAAHPDGRLAFIAALPAADAAEWSQAAGLPANVTPDGRFLVFTSSGRLTADDTSASHARQVFRYDAASGELIRVSIGDEGFNDNGNRSGPTPCAAAGGACSEDARIALPRGSIRNRRDTTMSDDGAYVFFDSPLALSPGALDDARIGTEEDGNPEYAQNVYEYHAGRVHLISDGRDTSVDRGQTGNCQGSKSSTCLLGSDASGANVFFSTADPLLAQDTDTELDYYDARICTPANPCIASTPQPAACVEDACQGSAGAPPPPPSAASLSFTGPGNPTPPRVASGVLVLGRVVHGSRFHLTVLVPGPGRVTIAGAQVRTVARSLARSGSYSFTVALTRRARAALRHRHAHTLKLRVRIAYLPVGGTPSSLSVTLTDKA